MEKEILLKISNILAVILIISIIFTVIYIYYEIKPIKIALNPFAAIAKINGSVCYINGIIVKDFYKPLNYSNYLNLSEVKT
jgi:hypothetical protein